MRKSCFPWLSLLALSYCNGITEGISLKRMLYLAPTLGDFNLGLVAFGPVVGSISRLEFIAEETASFMEAGSKEKRVWSLKFSVKMRLLISEDLNLHLSTFAHVEGQPQKTWKAVDSLN